jgi:hypothetical protein
MSLAAQEGAPLRRLLDQRAETGDPASLAAAFFDQVRAIIDTPWALVVGQDFLFPETRGDPPPNLAQTTAFGQALLHLAAEDPEAHRLWQEVANLLKPSSVYAEPALIQRVIAKMGAPA